MRAYADSSFILKLILSEAGSEAAIATYRRLENPKLFFLPLHELEVTNGILHWAFFQRRTGAETERKLIAHERDAAMSRLENWTKRRLIEATIDNEAAHQRAMELTLKHSERLGTRAIDILHVASALTLQSELFLTGDERQARLAEAEGLRVNVS